MENPLLAEGGLEHKQTAKYLFFILGFSGLHQQP